MKDMPWYSLRSNTRIAQGTGYLLRPRLKTKIKIKSLKIISPSSPRRNPRKQKLKPTTSPTPRPSDYSVESEYLYPEVRQYNRDKINEDGDEGTLSSDNKSPRILWKDEDEEDDTLKGLNEDEGVGVDKEHFQYIVKLDGDDVDIGEPELGFGNVEYKLDILPLNHFLKYSHVKPKTEKVLTISEMVNRKDIVKTVEGYKIEKMVQQLYNVGNSETQRIGDWEDILNSTKEIEFGHSKFLTIQELLKGNIQRSKVFQRHIDVSVCNLKQVLNHGTPIVNIINQHFQENKIPSRKRNIIVIP